MISLLPEDQVKAQVKGWGMGVDKRVAPFHTEFSKAGG